MDITSGHVSFGPTCPDTLMCSLQNSQPEAVAAITSLQTSFATSLKKYEHCWPCAAPAKDGSALASFISSISALQSLSIHNYENDIDILWRSIFGHADSLRNLGIHTPPQRETVKIWTLDVVGEVRERLPNLRDLELDISLADAERRLQIAHGVEGLDHSLVLVELTNFSNLRSLTLNIKLQDEEHLIYSGRSPFTVVGTLLCYDPEKAVCTQLAQAIWSDMLDAVANANTNPESSLRELTLRFHRRHYSDRGQFQAGAIAVRVRRVDVEATGKGKWRKVGGDKMVVVERKEWEPCEWDASAGKWPSDGVLKELIDQASLERLQALWAGVVIE
jgi:hypothetical protein